jgi:homeobox protein cut-like
MYSGSDFMLPHEIRQDEEASSNLEASLSAKEKIISELHLELRNVENALSKEREEHLLESKRLNTLVNEKVCAVYKYS